MLDQTKIDNLINSLKQITYKDKEYVLPSQGNYKNIDLKSIQNSFLVDINRQGRKKPKFTLQLRSKEYKEVPLLRLDLMGPPHPNPEGDFPYSGEEIPCPHIHIAHPDYGDTIAYPLNEKYAKMFLSEQQQGDFVIVLTEFLKRCNVGNIGDYQYIYQSELI